jgi:hypothetical protein
MLNGLVALALGSFISYGALRVLVAQAAEVRHAWNLRRRGRTATATTVSLLELDIEGGGREAIVSFEAEPGREVQGTVQLPGNRLPDLATGAPVQVRYNPATPTVLALEAGRRQAHAEIRQAVFIFVLIPVMVLPTSLYLVYAGLRMLLP